MMAGRGYLETVEDARRRAKRRLPRQVYLALLSGSQAGVTLRANVRSFHELLLETRVADWPRDVDLATTVAGHELSLPVICSPVGAQAVHPDGELAVARAAAEAGTAYGLSTFASQPLEDVVAANPQTMFQLFWIGSRDEIAARVDRAKRAGASGLILTLDWTFPTGRDWGSPYIPMQLDWKAMARYVPQALLHPTWLWSFVRSGELPTLGVPNLTAEPGDPEPAFFEAYGQWMQTPMPTWDDVAWLREQWDGPFLVKGILDPEDARRAADHGADAISVSNHGGNDVDGAVPSIVALPRVADAVGGRVDVFLDGGVRRGSDVVKAVALGAKAVLIGRAYLWGLAARGQAGVREILDIFHQDMVQTMTAIGASTVADIGRDHVIVPPGFLAE